MKATSLPIRSSHIRWGEGEVSLKDWEDHVNRQSKRGYQNIVQACAEAQSDKVEFLRVDTNCIDKSISAELSDAIKSMYNRHKGEKACHAYLSNVPHGTLSECKEIGSTFRRSRWFTRGRRCRS